MLQSIVKYDKLTTNPNTYLYKACMLGDIDIAKALLEMDDQNWEDALFSVCKFGHLDLVKLLIEKGVPKCSVDDALGEACFVNRPELAKELISLGATDFEEGLRCACGAGNIELVHLFIEHGATNFDAALETILYRPRQNEHHLELVKLMLQKGATFKIDCFRQAANWWDIEPVKLLLKHLSQISDWQPI